MEEKGMAAKGITELIHYTYTLYRFRQTSAISLVMSIWEDP